VAVPPELFDEDYRYFYGDLLDDDRSDRDTELIWRLLAPQPGARILDVPCGEGRITGRLAARGCSVIGIDSNDLFLGAARERWPAVSFLRRDMRELEYVQEFDALVNWFTSFGYFDTATNDRVLAAFARALKPGGKLLLDLHNPERLRRLLTLTGGNSAMLVERDGDLLIDRVSDDRVAGFSRTDRFIVRAGRVRRVSYTLEQIPPDQLVQRLRTAGFTDVRLFGRDGVAFTDDGPRLIAVAER
jgi:SAM-dependent methyltransferase